MGDIKQVHDLRVEGPPVVLGKARAIPQRGPLLRCCPGCKWQVRSLKRYFITEHCVDEIGIPETATGLFE